MVFLEGLFNFQYLTLWFSSWNLALLLLLFDAGPSVRFSFYILQPLCAELSQANSTPCECWKLQLQMRQKSSNTAVDKSFPAALQRFPCRCGACCCGKRSLCKECCSAVLCHCIQLHREGWTWAERFMQILCWLLFAADAAVFPAS